MDNITLLSQSRRSGLMVRVDGDELIVRGPRRLEHLALKLLDRKQNIIDMLLAERRQAEAVAPLSGPEILRRHAAARNRMELNDAADAWDRMARRWKRRGLL